MKIIRVFARRTKATPTDDLAYYGPPDLFAEADEVHISVAFTYDLRRAEQLERQWRPVAPIKIGGPATGMRGEEFTPGMYLKPGYVITSRGCPNRCWFCSVWKREGRDVRELPITEGFNVLDDNLLACSEEHIRAVFSMLEQKRKAPQFTGGLEAARMKEWIAHALKKLKPKQVFFAYDTPDDLEPLKAAGAMMMDAGFTRASHSLRCYVLCGYRDDAMDDAEERMMQAGRAGFTPMAMLWRDESGRTDKTWRQFQRKWARPKIIHGGSDEKK